MIIDGVDVPSPKVNGSPVSNAGIRLTSGLFKSKSSSTLLFWLASLSTMTTGISSPEFHASSVGECQLLQSQILQELSQESHYNQ